MPWSSTHKTETRERILDAAASAFRAEGVAAIGVGDVMGRAGLTHGGFYAHFESKEQLVGGGAPLRERTDDADVRSHRGVSRRSARWRRSSTATWIRRTSRIPSAGAWWRASVPRPRAGRAA